MIYFIIHLKLRRLYFFNAELKSDIKKEIYIEADISQAKVDLTQNKNLIFFEFTQKFQNKIKAICKIILSALFIWCEFPFFHNLLKIIYNFLTKVIHA